MNRGTADDWQFNVCTILLIFRLSKRSSSPGSLAWPVILKLSYFIDALQPLAWAQTVCNPYDNSRPCENRPWRWGDHESNERNSRNYIRVTCTHIRRPTSSRNTADPWREKKNLLMVWLDCLFVFVRLLLLLLCCVLSVCFPLAPWKVRLLLPLLSLF